MDCNSRHASEPTGVMATPQPEFLTLSDMSNAAQKQVGHVALQLSVILPT